MTAAYLAGQLRLDPKRIQTLKAHAALAGVVLLVIEDDRGAPLFIASKWAMTRQMHSVAEVESFLQRLAGAKA